MQNEIVKGADIIARATAICDILNDHKIPQDSSTCYGLTCVAVSMIADGAWSGESFDEAMKLFVHHIAEYAADIRNQVVERTTHGPAGTSTLH